MYSEIYTTSQFIASNGVVNYESLLIEVQASSVSGVISVDGIKGNVYVHLEEKLTEEDLLVLDTIISNHDGLPARTTSSLKAKRVLVLDNLAQMAHFHPLLKNFPDEITGYLTSVDNYFNAWVRDGNHSILFNKISSDAADINNDHYEYLNRQVNHAGAKTWQFLLSSIPTTPYL